MNTPSASRLFAIASLVVALISSSVNVQARQTKPWADPDAALFYDDLKPYGEWVSHKTYGTVWYPRHVPRNWRPYTDGHWDYTRQYGWLWVADEPWGWAPFHYGRWAWDTWYGWIWVPGRTWAPAWVFWRSGGGYASWAPMPPTVLWLAGNGLNTHYFNYDRDLPWDCWVTVSEHHLPNRHMHNHIVAPQQNRHIIPRTRSLNSLTVINQTIVNQGIPISQIEQVAGKPVPIVSPKIRDNVNKHAGKHQRDTHPEIVRINEAVPLSAEESQKHEALAIKLDRENAPAVQVSSPIESQLPGTTNKEPRIPGRLHHSPGSTPVNHNGANLQNPSEPGQPATLLDPSVNQEILPLIHPLPTLTNETTSEPDPPVNVTNPIEPFSSETANKAIDQQNENRPISTNKALQQLEIEQPSDLSPNDAPAGQSPQNIKPPGIIQPVDPIQPEIRNLQPTEKASIQEQSPITNKQELQTEDDKPLQRQQEATVEQPSMQQQGLTDQELLPVQDRPNLQQSQDQPLVQEIRIEQEQPSQIQQAEPVSQPQTSSQSDSTIQQQPEPIQQEVESIQIEQPAQIQQPEPVYQPETPYQSSSDVPQQPEPIQQEVESIQIEQPAQTQQSEPVYQPETPYQSNSDVPQQPEPIQQEIESIQIEQPAQIQQPEPVYQPETPSQPVVESQPPPEPVTIQAPPVQQPEAANPPKTSCVPTEQNNCTK